MFTHEDAMLPVLQFLADGQPHGRRQICDAMAEHFRLTADEREAILPSGAADISRKGTH